MSDGDNVQWLLNDFASEEKQWFGSINRGEFSMGWGMATGLIDLAPSVMNWYYENASTGIHQDEFIVGPSANGYMYPCKYPEEALNQHLSRLNVYMGRTDLSVVQVIEFKSLDNEALWDVYTQQNNIDGVIYLEYSNHAKHKGKVVWSKFMIDIENVIDRFDEDVRVITPSQMVTLLSQETQN